MRKVLAVAALSCLVLGGLALLWTRGVDFTAERAFAGSGSGTPVATGPLAPGKKVTFLELGSVGCRPCEAMKPVMEAVRDKYGKQVEVTFLDVKKNPSIAREWRVVLIPTQVFLDADGKEVFRHEGFFALGDVEDVLRRMGAR